MSGVMDWPAVAERTKQAIDEGQMLKAWRIAQESGLPLQQWPAAEPRRQASRLLQALGDQRQGAILDYLNWRAHRDDPHYYFHALYARAGQVPAPLAAGRIAEILRKDMPDSARADLLAYQSWFHSVFRDFETANGLMAQALALQPDDSWLHVQHSSILETADRYEESLEAARHALVLDPVYRAPVLQCADILVHLGRDDEALELVRAAHERTEQAAFPLRLMHFYSEREDHANALHWLDEAERLSPLANKVMRQWFDGRRSDFLFLAGDIDGCIEWAERSEQPFQKNMAARLRKPGARERKRVKLDVPFVRQHRMTCAPATLSAISAYWGRQHDHLEIADAICHDGTPWHKEREWAESHGFVTREFRLTEEILHALIDRGLPFTLTTQWATGGHLQACIGYDDRSGVLLVRDPTQRHYGEMVLEGLAALHPIDGPRGLVLVPREEASRLDGLVFPNEEAYSAYHRLLVTLDGHDRAAIQEAVATLRAVAPDSMLALRGEASAAAALLEAPREYQAIEALLERAPKEGQLLLRKQYLMGLLGMRAERRELLGRMATSREAHPAFISLYGELLLADARELPLAEHHLRRALRRQMGDSSAYESLAGAYDKRRRYGESMALRRAAACLSPYAEGYSRNYFESCRMAGRTEEGLGFLRLRTRSHGHRASGPWITLANAIDAVRSDREAAEILEEGRRARPDDGDLLLSGGMLMAGWGSTFRETGSQWVESAHGKVMEIAWLRAAARLALIQGDRPLAISRWREALAIQPIWREAWGTLAALMAEEEGIEAARRLLEELTAAHPTQTSFWALRSEWLAREPEKALAVLDRLLEIDPLDCWAHRERALRLSELRRGEEAIAAARFAVEIQPYDAASHGVLGLVLKDHDQEAAARAEFRTAVVLDVDYVVGLENYVLDSANREEALEALGFIEQELYRQVSNGGAVGQFQSLGWSSIEPPVLAEKLAKLCAERPDLWQIWSARLTQALQMHDHAAALTLGLEATRRFPLLPGAWLDLAKVHHAAGQFDDEEKAAAQACDLSPGWDVAARLHAEALERLHRLPEAEEVLRRTLAREPLGARNYAYLASFLIRSGRRPEVPPLLEKANEVAPLFPWAWETRARFAREDGPAAVEAVAEALRAATLRYSHRRSWWELVAEAWHLLGDEDESLRAILSGLERFPRLPGLRDVLALRHFHAGRIAEAFAACEAVPGDDQPPRELSGRRIWLLMHTGRPVDGMRAMKELLEREPGYVWGTAELAEWLAHRQQWEELESLAQSWVRAAPQLAAAHGNLGWAQRKLKRENEALASYQRAFFLDPAYRFVGRQIVEILQQKKDYPGAAATVKTLRRHTPGPSVECDAVELALEGFSDLPEALRIVTAMASDKDTEPAHFEYLAGYFGRQGRQHEWRQMIRGLGDKPCGSSAVLVAWLNLLLARQIPGKAIRRIRTEPAGSATRSMGWQWLIRTLKDRNTDAARATLTRLAGRFRKEWHATPDLWRLMTQVWTVIGKPARGRRWITGWRERTDDLNSATCVNIATLCDSAFFQRVRYGAEAMEVRRLGLERFPDRTESPALRAGLAFQLALRPDGVEEAGQILSQFEPGLTSDYYRALGDLAAAIVLSAGNQESQAADHARKAMAYAAKYPADRPLQRVRRRAEEMMLRHLPWARKRRRLLRKRWQLARIPMSQGQRVLLYLLGIVVLFLLAFLATRFGAPPSN